MLADVTANVRNHLPDYMGTPANRTLGLVVAGDDGRSTARGMGRTVSPRAFGHNGAGGQIAWADPETGLSFVLSDERARPARDPRSGGARPALPAGRGTASRRSAAQITGGLSDLKLMNTWAVLMIGLWAAFVVGAVQLFDGDIAHVAVVFALFGAGILGARAAIVARARWQRLRSWRRPGDVDEFPAGPRRVLLLETGLAGPE